MLIQYRESRQYMRTPFRLLSLLFKSQQVARYADRPGHSLVRIPGFRCNSSNRGLVQQKNKVMEETIKQKLGKGEYEADTSDNHISFTVDSEIKGSKYGTEFYVIMFTCGVCDTRMTRKFTKKSYHEGVVIIRCESCDSNHLISDNLGWFEDDPVNIEQIMERQGKTHKVIKVDDPAVSQIINQYMNNEQQQQEQEARLKQHQQQQLHQIKHKK